MRLLLIGSIVAWWTRVGKRCGWRSAATSLRRARDGFQLAVLKGRIRGVPLARDRIEAPSRAIVLPDRDGG